MYLICDTGTGFFYKERFCECPVGTLFFIRTISYKHEADNQCGDNEKNISYCLEPLYLVLIKKCCDKISSTLVFL